MQLTKIGFAIAALLPAALSSAADKPRVFVTESQALQVTGDASAGNSKTSVSATGGTSSQNLEVIRTFTQRCPEVTVTASREKADYVVRLDHEGLNPTTPFTHGNKVAVFNKADDLIYSSSTHVLSSAVKGACAAITASGGGRSGASSQPNRSGGDRNGQEP